MKQFLFVLLSAGIFVACSESTNSNDTTDTPQTQQAAKVDTPGINRTNLVAALQALKTTLTSNKAATVASIFPFPLPDSSFSIYADDDDFNAAYTKNGNSITKEMFVQHYTTIADAIWLDDINKLLNKTAIDSLNQLNEVGAADYNVAKPCYKEYQIKVENDKITLKVDILSNTNYKSKNKSKDEPTENSSEMCDSSLWWIFTFDGTSLKLVSISGAG